MAGVAESLKHYYATMELESLRAENRNLREQVTVLRQELKRFRDDSVDSSNSSVKQSRLVQTGEDVVLVVIDKKTIDDSLGEQEEGEIVVSDAAAAKQQDWTANHSSTAGTSAADQGCLSVADMVRSAAEQTYTEQAMPGYTLDAATGLYYNPDTGYYYDTKTSLFYHPSTQQHYFYDTKKNSFAVYVDPATQAQSTSADAVVTERKGFTHSRYKRMARKHTALMERHAIPPVVFETLTDLIDDVLVITDSKRIKRRYGDMLRQSDADLQDVIDLTWEPSRDGKSNNDEIFISDDEPMSDDGELVSSDEDDEVKEMLLKRRLEKEADKYPPCIRLMEHPPGQLHIVTIAGANIGRQTSCDVRLNDGDGISRVHAKITYDAEDKRYTVQDLNSKHGTLLNELLIEEKHRLRHEDRVRIGTKTLIVHIHSGLNTCAGCEPGLTLNAGAANDAADGATEPAMTAGQKEKLRRHEVKSMMKKYGLQGDAYRRLQLDQSQYQDRAQTRRVTKGSVHPSHERPVGPAPEPASVNKAISAENKGFKLLEKMGWKDGQRLGKTMKGLKTPLAPQIRFAKSGLGAGPSSSIDELADPKAAKKKAALMKTQQRYNRAHVAPIFTEDVQIITDFKSGGTEKQ